jgi:hypothetical protein
MEPSVNEIKKILRHHEEYSQANNSSLLQLMTKFGEYEEIMARLTQRMEEIKVSSRKH